MLEAAVTERMAETKVCRGCGSEQPIEAFPRNRRAADGRGSLCLACTLRARYEREKQRASGSLPPFEQWLKNRYEVLGGPIPARRNLTVRQLERLFFAGKISDLQLEAGGIYRTAYERAGILQRVTARYEPPTVRGECTYGMPATEREAHYRQIVREADEALSRPLRIALTDIAVLDFPLEPVGRVLGYRHPRSARQAALEHLHGALDILIRHFGVRPTQHGRAVISGYRMQEPEVRPDMWEGGQTDAGGD